MGQQGASVQNMKRDGKLYPRLKPSPAHLCSEEPLTPALVVGVAETQVPGLTLGGLAAGDEEGVLVHNADRVNVYGSQASRASLLISEEAGECCGVQAASHQPVQGGSISILSPLSIST